MMKQERYIKLKIGELIGKEDSGRGIARIDSKAMKELGIKEGDIIEIEGTRRTAAVAVRSYPADVGLNLIRVDGLVRKNAGTSIGEFVKVGVPDVKEAKKVVLAPVEKGLQLLISPNLIKQNIFLRPVTKGDILLALPVFKKRRRGPEDIIEEFFGLQPDEIFLPMAHETKLMVVKTDPAGPVKITEITELEILPEATELTEAVKAPTVTYEDIGGLGDSIQKIREMIELPLKHPEIFERLGIEPPKGVLLHGPPGCGKTLLAKAVANEAGANFISIAGPEVMSKFYGESLPADEHIFTINNGIVEISPIGSVVENRSAEAVAEFDENGKIVYGKIKNFIKHPMQKGKKIFEITTASGRSIKVTDYHSLFTLKDGKVMDIKTSELVPGKSYIAIPSKLPHSEKFKEINILKEIEKLGLNLRSMQLGALPPVIPLNEEWAMIIGLFIANGSYNKNAIKITNSLPEVKEMVKRFAAKYNLKLKEYKDDIILNSKPLKILFEKILGIKTEAENKGIPGKLLSMPLNALKALVKGYFTGNGSVYPSKLHPTIAATTVSKRLANDLMYTLLFFGIITKCSIKKERNKGIGYRILIESQEGFERSKAIGFLDKKRNEKIEYCLMRSKFNKGIEIPIWAGLRQFLKENLKEFAHSKTIGKDIVIKKLHEIDNNKTRYPDLWKVVESDIYWDRVTKIKELKNNDYVYDISVNPNENFVAGFGGIFAHNSEANIRKIFDEAEKNAPSIIFIDEIDAIAPKREEVTGEVERRVVAQLLTQMDGLKSRGKVIVIAATNRPNSLDPALRRPGRFDREIEIPVPDKKGRKEILLIHTRYMPLEKDVNIDKIAEITHGFVGADLAAVAKEAAMHTLRRVLPEVSGLKENEPLPKEIIEKLRVTKEDFEYALRVVQPSAMREVLVEVPKVKWSDVGGLEEVKQALKESVEWQLKNFEGYERLGIKPPKGILLYGPPGCGKTHIVRALANESGANFISVKGPEVFSKFVGESEKFIRDVFRRARQVAPAIIFFDEIDSIAPRRGTEVGTHVTEQVVSQLLAEMSGIEELKQVIVIAATNRPDIIDPALLRPGRFDRLIYVPQPDEKTRLEILKTHVRNMPLKGVSLEKIAKNTEGYSGADLEAVVNEAAMNALRENEKATEVTQKHFDMALKKIKPSITEDMATMYKKTVEKMRKAKIKEEETRYIG